MADWKTVKAETPPRHDGVWRVFRDGHGFFDAMVCYGMHSPWWVPRNGFTGVESEPFSMLPGDLWQRQPSP